MAPEIYFNVFNYGNSAVESFKDLVGAAHGVLQDAGFSNLQTHSFWSAGFSTNNSAIIAFVGGTQVKTNAVITVAGPNSLAIRDQLTTALKNVKWL